MNRNATYKNYTIRSTPLQPLDPTHWTIAIVIDWERDGQVTGRSFSVESPYQTEEDAHVHGVTFGQRIIDGKVHGLSVD